MQILTTLLAEILVGARFFCHDPNTTTMLPYLADVALHEQAGGIVRNIGREKWIEPKSMLETVLGVLVEWRRALVLVVAAHAANGFVLVLVITVAVRHGGRFGFVSSSFPFFNLSAGSPAGPEGVFRCNGVFWRFRRERSG
jgi:hypothetical protein